MNTYLPGTSVEKIELGVDVDSQGIKWGQEFYDAVFQEFGLDVGVLEISDPAALGIDLSSVTEADVGQAVWLATWAWSRPLAGVQGMSWEDFALMWKRSLPGWWTLLGSVFRNEEARSRFEQMRRDRDPDRGTARDAGDLLIDEGEMLRHMWGITDPGELDIDPDRVKEGDLELARWILETPAFPDISIEAPDDATLREVARLFKSLRPGEWVVLRRLYRDPEAVARFERSMAHDRISPA